MHIIGLIDETPKEQVAYSGMTKSELIELAESKGIELTPSEKRSKDKILEKL